MRLLGLVLQHLDRHILGKMLGKKNTTNTQESGHRRARGVMHTHISMHRHTEASCCNTFVTLLTAVQLQEKKKFRHTCKSGES